MGLPEFLFLIEILIFLVVRSPYKISEPYNNPFWAFSNGVKKKSEIILPEERGYNAGRARLYFCNENSGLPNLLRTSLRPKKVKLLRVATFTLTT